MKRILLFSFAALAVGVLFSSCKKDDPKESVTRTYTIFINGSQSSKTSSESEGLNELKDYYFAQLQAANTNSIKEGTFSITGTGKTAEDALKDADEQARAIFVPLATGIESAIKTLDSEFTAKRKALASKILTDPTDCYLKYEVYYFLKRNTLDITVEADEFLFSSEKMATLEAKGGEDYSK